MTPPKAFIARWSITCLFFRGGDPQLELYLLCFDLGWWYDNRP